jgi:cysteinyl-tRNA synthetase
MIKDFHSIPENELPLFKTNLIRATTLIGVCQSSYEDWISVKNENVDEDKINILIAERLKAKKIKDFERADQIRQELLDMNIEIKDNQQGTDWSVKS